MFNFIKNLLSFLKPAKYPEWWQEVEGVMNQTYIRGKRDCSNILADGLLHIEKYWPDAFPGATHVWTGDEGHAIGMAVDSKGDAWYFDYKSRVPTQKDLIAEWENKKYVPKYKLGNKQYPEWYGIKYRRKENGEIVKT